MNNLDLLLELLKSLLMLLSMEPWLYNREEEIMKFFGIIFWRLIMFFFITNIVDCVCRNNILWGKNIVCHIVCESHKITMQRKWEINIYRLIVSLVVFVELISNLHYYDNLVMFINWNDSIPLNQYFF